MVNVFKWATGQAEHEEKRFELTFDGAKFGIVVMHDKVKKSLDSFDYSGEDDLCDRWRQATTNELGPEFTQRAESSVGSLRNALALKAGEISEVAELHQLEAKLRAERDELAGKHKKEREKLRRAHQRDIRILSKRNVRRAMIRELYENDVWPEYAEIAIAQDEGRPSPNVEPVYELTKSLDFLCPVAAEVA